MSKVVAGSERRTKLAQPVVLPGHSEKAGDVGVAPGFGCQDPVTTVEQRWQLIAEAAYFLAEKRGFACGCELDDWLRAERDIDAALVQAESDRSRYPASGREE